MSESVAIFLCDRSGVMAGPWAEAGVECWCVDVQHSIRRERVEGLVHYVWGDARSWTPPPGRCIAFLAAFPPCTHTANSGARDFKTKGLRTLTDALDLFNACLFAGEWSGARYLVEQPMGVLSTHHRSPDYRFHPHEYALFADDPESEAYTKETCLWTGGGFVMPPVNGMHPAHGSKMHRLPPSPDRADLRAVTPGGFARAVFESNREAAGSLT